MRHLRQPILWPLLFLLLILPSSLSAAKLNPAGLKSAIDDQLVRAGPQGDCGCAIFDTIANRSVYANSASRPFIPASNQKLIVGAAALLHCGPDYRSATLYFADGSIRDGMLYGNLIVSGFGAIHFTARYPRDQTISQRNTELNRQLDVFAGKVRAAGIRQIAGHLVLGWSDWSDMPRNPHYPAAAPLLFNENTIDISVKSGVILHTPAQLIGFRIHPQAWPGRQKRLARDGQATDTIVIDPAKDSVDYWRLDETPPLLYYREHIRHGLNHRDIAIEGGIINHGDKVDRYLLFALPSLKLAELLHPMGQYSDNLRAEIIFLNLGYLIYGKANYKNATRAVSRIFDDHDVPLSTMNVADGSGLSRSNRVSPNDLITVLRSMLATGHKNDFMRMLPIANESGTLRSRFHGHVTKGRIIAKTGTLRDVVSLSGYVLRNAAPVLAFSVLCNDVKNHREVWRRVEDIGELMVAYADSR